MSHLIGIPLSSSPHFPCYLSYHPVILRHPVLNRAHDRLETELCHDAGVAIIPQNHLHPLVGYRRISNISGFLPKFWVCEIYVQYNIYIYIIPIYLNKFSPSRYLIEPDSQENTMSIDNIIHLAHHAYHNAATFCYSSGQR